MKEGSIRLVIEFDKYLNIIKDTPSKFGVSLRKEKHKNKLLRIELEIMIKIPVYSAINII